MPRSSLALALIVILVSGCGGDDEKPEQRAPAKVPAAFTEQVDSICRDMGKQLRQLGTRPSRTKQESEYLAYTSDVSAVFLDGVRQFRPLKLSPGDAGARARRASALSPAMHAPLRDELGASTCAFELRGGRRVARSRAS